MSSAIDADTAAKIRDYAVNQPEKAPIEILGHFGVDPSRAGAVKRIVEAARDGDEIDLELDTDDETGTDENDETGVETYITDDGFENTTENVREHYRRMRPVYETLADVDGYPTTGVPSNRYWYKYDRENELDIDELEAGYKLARRPYVFETDFDEIVGRIEVDDDEPAARTLYTITSQKDREATYDRALATEYDDFGSGDGLADYSDMRALPFWADVDLDDGVKPRRGDLDDDEREAIEAAFGMIIDEIAAVYGPRIDAGDVAAFDSGGGMYPWGPAATTLPIADHFEGDTGPHVDAREYVFGELADRMNAYLQGDATYYTKEGEGAGDAEGHGFEGIVPRVIEVIPEADELLDVDGLMNTNRQSKAPGSIHKRHDVAVTPLRNADGRIDYSPTPLSEIDDDVIDRTVDETERITTVTEDATADETIDSLIGTLFPEYSELVESEGWRTALETALENKRDQLREKDHKTALGELEQRRRRQQIRDDLEGDLDREPTEDEVSEAISSTVTPIKKDVHDAIDAIDVRDVIRDYAADEWDTSNRSNETTFDPSWRSSGSGMSCYVTKGDRSTFGDNSCNGGGGPEKAYALGTGIMRGGSNAAARDMTLEQREKARNGLRRAGYEIPVYVPEKGSENSDGETYERTPLWALRKAAVALGVVDPNEFVERDGDDGGSYDWFPDAESFNATLDALDDAGIDHGCEPITGGSSGSGRALGPDQFCEECEPPLTAHAEPLDVDARRDEMQGEAYDRFVETDDLTLWAYNPGEGKTTNGSVAPAERERSFVVALPKHENCREFQLDEMKPDGCFHLKGAAQPEGDECMDASIDDRDCKDHGHGSNCPSMCPVYDLDQDHPKRILFDVFAAAGKSRKAHALLGLYDESWHGESCAWLDQWEELENVDRIVTVHQYLRLKSVREHGDILIDDIGAGFVDDETVNVDALSRCRQALRKYARFAENDDERVADTLRLLEMFTDDLIAELAEGAIDLRELEAPTFPPTTRTYESRDEIPDHVDEANISETRSKQYVGEGGQYVYQDAYEVVTKDLAETLAQARHFYEESVLTAMREGEWNGTPLCLDTVYGALAAALDDQEAARAVRVAIEADVTLDECPRCSSRLEARDGARMCDECGWHEEYDRLTQDHTPPARVDVDVSTTDGGTVELADRRLPSIDSLPDPSDVLILDATPQTTVYAAVFGVDPASVRVEGNDAYELPNATVTQFINGAYHKGTLEDSSVARSNIQKCLEKVSSIHDNVVYVSLKKVEAMFDWPDTSVDDVMNYYSLRGLDAAKDADAIVLVGAPHPDENDLRAEGRLLALDNPGVRAGGRELSTRNGDRDDPDDDPGPPIYRKLNYVDDDGKGRAMAAKRYSGITGDLFDARHEDELVQAAHRIRPLLADATGQKHIYLCTNVPTDLPVDRVTTFDDFLDPLSGHVEVRDSALDLLGAMVDAATESEDGEPYATDGGLLSVAAVSSEWYEASERAGMDVSERTVRNALNDLREAGLVEKGEYTQRGGYLQTLTRLGASVAAIRR